MQRLLEKKQLGHLIKVLEKTYQIHTLTVLPPKKLFYPPKETLFEFANNVIQKPCIGDKPIAILGLSCNDLAGITLLDKVMNRPQDWYYWQRRNKSLLVGLGPRRINIDENSYDLFFEEHRSDYLVISGSDKGKGILRSTIFKKTDLDPKPTLKTIDPLFADKEKLSRALKASYHDKIWDNLTKTCFGCGICAYVCPVCYCFDIDDKINLESKECPSTCELCSGKRERNWTACFLPQFSQVAGGYNFRNKLKDRIYNWYHHKFVRFPQEFDTVGCVSCGRCIKYCPAGINYRKVLEEVMVKYS